MSEGIIKKIERFLRDKIYFFFIKPNKLHSVENKLPWFLAVNNITEAWTYSKGGGTIHLVDSCVSFAHPLLESKKHPKNLECTSTTTHGTEMASIIASLHKKLKLNCKEEKIAYIAGVTHLSKIKNYATDNRETVEKMRAALQRAVSDARDDTEQSIGLINFSIKLNDEHQDTLNHIIKSICERNNTLLIVAAGNEKKMASFHDSIQACRGKNSIIIVGALQPYENFQSIKKTEKSNYGIQVDIFAPGELIPVLIPDEINLIKMGSGTSHAAAIVTGTLSLANSCKHDLSAVEFKAALLETAKETNTTVNNMNQVIKVLHIAEVIKKICVKPPKNKTTLEDTSSLACKVPISDERVPELSGESFYTVSNTEDISN